MEKAIDAQHGGFPSRLLDVTYNCLVALYFAVTPYYFQAEDSQDQEDGKVYIFQVDKMYCPTGNNINMAYEMIINRSGKWITGQPIFQKNHKLIDHIKLNSRIIAQQGAFILFQGDEGEEIPNYQYKTITIKGTQKRILREELKMFCGIHTGSIYPEKYNRVNEIVEKSNRLNPQNFTFENELDMVLRNLEKCLAYYMACLIENIDKEKVRKIVFAMEKHVQSFKEGIERLATDHECGEKEVENYKEIVDKMKIQYNGIIEDFFEEMQEIIPPELELAKEFLTIQ